MAALRSQSENPKIFNGIITFIHQESQRSVIAPTNAFVLLEWTVLLQQHVASSGSWQEEAIENLCVAGALALEKCVTPGVRDSLQRSAVVMARRGVRALLKSEPRGAAAVKVLVSRLASGAGSLQEYAPYLGVISGVCARLPARRTELAHLSGTLLAFYAHQIITSKQPAAQHITGGFRDVFAHFASLEDVSKDLVPTLEKSMLRSPEIVFQGLIPSLVSSFPQSFDLAEITDKKLLSPILSSMKSANAAIRDGAFAAVGALLTHCHDDASLMKIANTLVSNLKSAKTASAEFRILLAHCFSVLRGSPQMSKSIVEGIFPLVCKEANEGALDAQVKAFAHHLASLLLADISLPKEVVDGCLKACEEKRVSIRRKWLVALTESIWLLKGLPSQDGASKFVREVISKVHGAYLEVIANPLPAVQSGLVTAAYLMTSLCASPLLKASEFAKLSPNSILTDSLLTSSKLSYLMNAKVYTKLILRDDLIWATRALTATAGLLSKSSLDSRVAWAQAVLYIMTSAQIPSITRKEAARELSKSYFDNPEVVGECLVSGIWHWIRARETGEKDSAAVASQSEAETLGLPIRLLTPPATAWQKHGINRPQEVLESEARWLLVLCRQELVPSAEWISTSLRCGIDPGSVVSENPKSFLEEALARYEYGAASGIESIQLAACQAMADLLFVAPEQMTPLIVDQIRDDLDPEQFGVLGPTEAAIARAPEGTTFIDPLAQSQRFVENKNVKDYDLLKWEEDMRVQLAQKKGQQRKLTADERAKVDAQLAKESEIRARVQAVRTKVRRGAELVQALAKGPPSDARRWMSVGTNALINAIIAGADFVVGDEIFLSYIACKTQVSNRLGSLRQAIGVATLRAVGHQHLPPELLIEPEGDLITRVLYRIRFAAEQRPFDSTSLSYMLPLIYVLIDDGAKGYAPGEEADTQVLLALEFLSFQMEACADLALPRADTLKRLLHALQTYTAHYRLIKDTLLEFCKHIAGSISAEELKILLDGSTVSQSSTRNAVLQAISDEIDLTDLDYSKQIWLACHDTEAENADLGNEIWTENALDVQEELVDEIVPYLRAQDRSTRTAAARALNAAVDVHEGAFEKVLGRLQKDYAQDSQPVKPRLDKYGMAQKTNIREPWEARSGCAMALQALSSHFDKQTIVSVLQFLIDRGPLADRNETVRNEMVEAGTSIVALKGAEALEALMGLFETVLEGPDKATQESDWINEAVIVLYGCLSRHLKAGDTRVAKVISKLLATLSTPSEPVQFAVANCLPPLVRLVGDEFKGYVELLLDKLLHAKQYAARRGAAYGLAGLIKGRGISSLRQYRIISNLRAAAEDKKSTESRQGAMFAFELMSLILGRTFEPYVIEILPQLLACFGDTQASVRDACLDTAKTCFASLSSFGVHQLLPQLLEGLDETQWRSKKGACDLLGAMAYLDPGQLAHSLPDIIPPLTAVLTDSHKEVRTSANRSLQRFGEVINNPEIKSLVDVLLKALSDPTKYTEEALDGLIRVNFIHYIDAPSLALVTRILERGLSDRSSTKRKAAQIIGSLAHLTERRDLSMHLPVLVSGLRVAAVDPVPATRATASKALGSLVEKLGEDALPDLIPSLMSSLRSDLGAGDRLGSAQALSEVLAGLGTSRLEETLPTILQNVSSTKPSVREGFMTLFIFLPACFGNNFANYLSQVIPSILGGLADDLEAIRDIALRAGRLLVKNFATKAIDLLLPELQRGLADDSYRIRLSSVELIGDLLFSLTGIENKPDDAEEDDNAAQAGQSLLEVLGEERRNKVLSSLYICRCDTSGMVRTAAINVWKALVATPRTLRDIVPTLTRMIIIRLGSSNMEQKVIAGNALGEVIRKAGDGVLATLLPALEDGLQTSTDVDNRQGICIALREVVQAAAPEAIEEYEKKLISIVRIALVDSNADVREAAAESFDSLQQVFGRRAVDQVLPHLLHLLGNDEEAGNALSALLTLLTETTRANVILPNLIPTLLASPISAFNAKALASLAQVGGPTMVRRVPIILNTLTDNILAAKDDELKKELEAAFAAVLSSVDEFDGLNTAMSVMLALVKHDDHKKRAIAASQLARFFASPTVDYSRYNQDLIRVLMNSFDDRDKNVVEAAWLALSQLQAHLKKEQMESLTISTRQILQQVGVSGSNLPGFALPKGLMPVLQIFLQGLLNGSSEQRIQAALGISDIIERTSPESLKPFVTHITGPLIRVVSERSIDVKCAILFTLNQLLEKIPTFLRPFLPQLQRTFTKSLADPSSADLRTRATKALSTLITLTPRVDPLIAELVTGSKITDTGVRTATLKALQDVVSKVGASMSENSRDAILTIIDSASDADDMITNARLLGAMIKVLPAATATALIKSRILSFPITESSMLAINAVLLETPESLTSRYTKELEDILTKAISHKNIALQHSGALAAGKLLLADGVTSNSTYTSAILALLSNSYQTSRRHRYSTSRTGRYKDYYAEAS